MVSGCVGRGRRLSSEAKGPKVHPQLEENIRLVEQSLKQSELRYDKIAEDTYRLTFQGHSLKDIIVCIRVQIHWVQMYCLYITRSGANFARAAEWLMQRNHTSPMVKFAMTEDEELVLQVDISDDALNLRTFQTAIQALVTAADESYPEFVSHLHG